MYCYKIICMQWVSSSGHKTTIMKSTKVQTLGGIWLKFGIFGLKTPLRASIIESVDSISRDEPDSP